MDVKKVWTLYFSATGNTDKTANTIADALARIYERRDQYKGMKIVYEGPIVSLRHFTAGFELL